MWYGGLSKIAFETTLEQDGTFTVYATPNMAGDIQWSRSAGGGGTVTITAPVPEPAGWAWTGGLALAGWGLWRRRKGR
ncbi:MAG: hypothetical protein D6766_01575 [Verrucomicrobia bacterium]|nr:MAG: hypothetical protein D6766_01575 [Verrucomicrobiota bacterium]